jgi:hypothetical protein
MISAACWRRNCLQLTLARLGAGSMPSRWRMFQTLLGDSEMPSPTSSPWIRWYPQVSRVLRREAQHKSSRLRCKWRPAGRPRRYVQRRRMNGRCQRTSVAGWTRSECLRARGKTWVSAARIARSATRTRGRAICPQHLQLVPKEDLDLVVPVGPPNKHEQLEEAADRPIQEGQALKQQALSSHPPTIRAVARNQAPPQRRRRITLGRPNFWDLHGS